MIRLKPGVRIVGIRPELVIGLQICEGVYVDHGYVCTVTSIIDGKHSRASLHYTGAAADLRTRHIENKDEIQEMADQMRNGLGDDFDLVIEKDHYHLEYQPKAPY